MARFLYVTTNYIRDVISCRTPLPGFARREGE